MNASSLRASLDKTAYADAHSREDLKKHYEDPQATLLPRDLNNFSDVPLKEENNNRRIMKEMVIRDTIAKANDRVVQKNISNIEEQPDDFHK